MKDTMSTTTRTESVESGAIRVSSPRARAYRWCFRSSLFILALTAYVVLFCCLRSVTHVTSSIPAHNERQLQLHTTHFVSLAYNDQMHKLLTCLFLPLVALDAKEVRVTFGYSPSRGAFEAYESGAKFYVSGEQLKVVDAVDAVDVRRQDAVPSNSE